jgi:tetratricopeptide (TPR) repeat protein
MAAAEYRSYLTQYPDDSRVWFRLGWTYMAGLGQFEAAAEAFARVLRVDPKDSAAAVNLATCYGGLRQFERAVTAYEQAFALNPDEIMGVFVNGEYGAALMHTGRLVEARAAFEKMTTASASVSRARGLRSLAFLDMYQGHYHAAVDRLRQAIALNLAAGGYVSVFRDRLIVVTALQATGSAADARRELSNVHALITRHAFGPEWLQMLVRIEARLGNVAAAERVAGMMPKVIGNVVVGSSSNRNTAADQGLVEIAQAEIEIARGRHEKAAALAVSAAARLDRYQVLDTLALSAAAAGRPEDAAARYTELIGHANFNRESQEEWFNAHVALGRLHERAGRHADARKLYERIIELWKDGDPDLVALTQVRARVKALPQ